MGIVSLLVSASAAAILYLVFLHHPLPSWAFWIYAWIPGGLGLLWSHMSHIKIPFLPKDKRSLFGPPLLGFAIGTLSFFISQWFSSTPSSETTHALPYLFSYYGVFLLVFFLLFLGGEICWRGYLWKLWESHPLKGGIAIWLLWSLWLAPEAIASSKSIFSMSFLNFSLMPLLHFFREKSQSIVPGTLFYSSLCASSIYIQVLFSSTRDSPLLSIIQGSILLTITLGFFLFRKIKKTTRL